MIADWCVGSGSEPANPRDAVDGAGVEFGRSGCCFRCGRRVRLLTSGRLRRHRPTVNVLVAARRDGPAPATPPRQPAKRPRR